MKKIIIILTTIFIASCAKIKEEENKKIPPKIPKTDSKIYQVNFLTSSEKTISGTWYISNNKPAYNIRLNFYKENNKLIGSTITDKKGKYSFKFKIANNIKIIKISSQGNSNYQFIQINN